METKKYTQFGTFTMALMIPFFLYSFFLFIQAYLSNSPEVNNHLVLMIIFLICLLTFYKLTIKINSTYISFTFGIGFFGKSYKLKDVSSCKPVSNSLLYGIGIRWIPNGWLYNVSGLKAIQLHFKNRSSIVRIGTNKGEEICKFLEAKLDDKPSPGKI